MTGWESAGVSDTGLLRDQNEDRYWVDDQRGVFLVVDGVGGQAAGELAAETAVSAIRETVAAEGTAEERVRRAITHANNRIFEMAQKADGWRGMACVLTLAVVEGQEVTIGHVGDSRLYLVWNGSIRKVTSDHSPVGEDEDAGELTEVEAMLDPRRNEVFRDVGSKRRSESDEEFIEVRHCRMRPDAAMVLCSDGLTDHLTAAQVRSIVEGYEGNAARVAEELVDAANAAGGRDNITAVVVAGPDFGCVRAARTTRPRLVSTRLRRKARRFTSRLALLSYGVLLGMLVWAVMRIRG